MARRQKTIGYFVALSVVLVVATVSLSIGWVVIESSRLTAIILGGISILLLLAGLIVYTVFLVLEIKRNEEHDSFINAVTHELKTPIASIRLYLETLQARELSDEQRRHFYDVMLADADRLHHTVDEVLKAGVVREQKRQASRTLVDMGAVTRECVEIAARRHHLAPDAIALDTLGDQALLVLGEPDDLRTIISNLLDNAVKYSGDAVRVTVALATPTPDTIWVRVQDRGVGIPSRQLKRIFNRFYRVQTLGMRHIKGTGLGLYIVRSLARAHGGRVFAQSEGEGRGATFTLELPRAVRA